MATKDVIKKCSIEGCKRKYYASGFCHPHYARNRLLGDPLAKYENSRNNPEFGKPRNHVIKKESEKCSIEGCCYKSRHLGLCEAHYGRLRRHGDPLAGKPHKGVVTRQQPTEKRICMVVGCESPHTALGYCNAHLRRYKKYGNPIANQPIRKPMPGEREYKDGGGYIGRWDKELKKVVWDHRVVLEKLIGRPLTSNENVHHINGNKSDNRPENLELWVSTQPSGQTVHDLLAYAREILKTYGPLESKTRPRLRLKTQ